MLYRTYEPPADLAHCIRFWWTLESDAEGAVPHRLMAETCPNIVAIPKGRFTEADGTPTPAVHLAGALPAFMDNTAHGPFSLFGVYLWPWSVRPLFGRAPEDCFGKFIGLDTLWPVAGSVLEERLIAAPDHDERRAIMTQTLRDKVAPSSDALMEGIVQRILTGNMTNLPTAPSRSLRRSKAGQAGVEDLIAASGLARRQFERRFKQCTGFPPALFLRIVRFQRTYRMLENGEAGSLTELAHASGYFDQSHFIRDFKRLGGLNPRSYFVKAPEKVDNFVRLPE